MPHEDKQSLASEAGKEKKRFKAVTEEITSVPPKIEETHRMQEYHEPKREQYTQLPQQAVSVAETNNLTTGTTEKPKRNVFLFFVIMLLVAFVVMALAGGLYVYLNGVRNLPNTETSEVPAQTSIPQTVAQATPAPVGGPTATPKPDYSLYNVSVLNGSGAIGAATGVKDLIQKGGFKVNYTGNADNFGFTDTIIQVKSTVSADVVASLKNLLVPTYSVKIGTALDSQSRWDIIVTVGSK